MVVKTKERRWQGEKGKNKQKMKKEKNNRDEKGNRGIEDLE